MKALAEQINELDGIEIYGRVVGVRGLMVEVAGPLHAMSVGARVVIETPAKSIPSEVIGFSGPYALLMPFAPLEGVRRGCRALVTSVAGAVPEVQEFLQDDLGDAGLARSVVVVSTSDEPALMRRQAAHVTLAIAEYFRDDGKNVLVLMDSVTRFAMAQREIGLSAGEPPTAKGYTPTVFTELPRLLERAGPGTEQGTITGIFTVLVDGDDHNEPIADAVRGILDGHIVMERAIAERGRYPAINVLKSVSRTMPRAADPAYLAVLTRARQVMATYADMEELIRLGAYRAGTSADVDEAIRLHKPLEAFLAQGKEEATSLAEGYQRLAQIMTIAETER
jgi:flagellum-specific ATP synthase